VEATSYISIISAIISIFCGIAAVIVVLRKQFKVIKEPDQTIIDDYLTVEKKLIDQMRSTKSQICIMSTTIETLLLRTQSQFIQSLKEAAQRGVTINFMLIDPRAGHKALKYPGYKEHGVEETRRVIYTFTDLFRDELKIGNLELRLSNEYSPFFIFFSDDLLCFSKREIKTGSYILVNSKHELYQKYYSRFFSLWSNGITSQNYLK